MQQLLEWLGTPDFYRAKLQQWWRMQLAEFEFLNKSGTGQRAAAPMTGCLCSSPPPEDHNDNKQQNWWIQPPTHNLTKTQKRPKIIISLCKQWTAFYQICFTHVFLACSPSYFSYVSHYRKSLSMRFVCMKGLYLMPHESVVAESRLSSERQAGWRTQRMTSRQQSTHKKGFSAETKVMKNLLRTQWRYFLTS